MSGPWELYQSDNQSDQVEDGPWSQFAPEESGTATQKPYTYVEDIGGNVDPNAVRIETKGTSESLTENAEPEQSTSDPSLLERAAALPAGVNRGVVGLFGIPVDTAANVIDLGKAAVGLGYNEAKKFITGKPSAPPAWTEPYDRRTVPGSSEWIAARINQGANALGVRSPIDNPRPDDPLSRVIYSAGQFAGSSVNPNPQAKVGALQQAFNIGGGALAGLSAGAVGEAAPEWAGLASLVPQATMAGGAGALKLALRGGERGRRAMEQRIQDLRNGGINDPSVGLASGNKLAMGIENLLAQTPFSSDLYRARGEQNISGMQNKVNKTRDAISPEFGPVVAGNAIQSDLKNAFKNRINATERSLMDRVAASVGNDFVVPIDASIAKSTQLSTPIKGAEASSSQLINPRIEELAKNLKLDAYGKRLVAQSAPGGRNPTLNSVVEPKIPANSSLWNAPKYPATVSNPSLWNAPSTNITRMPQRSIADRNPTVSVSIPNASLWNKQKQQGIPFGALKALRSDIGQEAASNAIIGTPEQSQFKQLYGAMSDDMKRGVAAADRTQAGVQVGPLTPEQQPGLSALNRANNFYSKAMNRVEELNPLANKNTPEGAFNTVANSLGSGPTIYERLRGAITPQSRQKIAATIIDDMGKATPGQQGVAGDTWSPRTFLTNYAKLYENGGGDALFKRLPGGEKHAENLADIAKASEMIGDASKVWSNPSGTAAALSARGALYTLTAGAFLHPIAAAGTGATLALGNQVSKRLLLNPEFVDWLAKSPTVRPEDMQKYTQRLLSAANGSRDKQFQSDVSNYLRSVNDGLE